MSGTHFDMESSLDLAKRLASDFAEAEGVSTEKPAQKKASRDTARPVSPSPAARGGPVAAFLYLSANMAIAGILACRADRELNFVCRI